MSRFDGAAGRGAGILVAAVVLAGAAVTVAPAAGKALTKKKADARYVNVGERASDSDLLDGTDSQDYAKDSEVVPAVLAADGQGSALDADTLDGAESATSSTPESVFISNQSGTLPPFTVDGESIANVGRAIRVPVHELDAPFTAGTFPAQVMVGDVPALAFDANAVETVNFAVRMPNDVTPGPVSLNLLWSSTATSGSVMWSVTLRSLDSVEVVDADGFTDLLLTASSTGMPAKRRNEVTIDLGSATSQIDASDLLVIRLVREVTDSNDTMAADANLHAIEVRYPAEQ